MSDKDFILGVEIGEPSYILTENQFKRLKDKISLLITEKNALKREVKDLKRELENMEEQRDHYMDMYGVEIGLDI